MKEEFEPRFIGDLTITQLTKAWKLFRVERTITFFPDEDSWVIGEGIEIPEGFITDGPSIPQFFWNILPVWGSWALAGVLHDWLCCRIELKHPHPLAKTRPECDRMFHLATGALGVPIIPRSLLRLGVWLGTKLNVPTTMVSNNAKLQAAMKAMNNTGESDAESQTGFVGDSRRREGVRLDRH